MKTKVCCECGERKTKEDFYKNACRVDGIQSRCKQCCKNYAQDCNNLEKSRESCRKWYHNNPEKERERCRKWRRNNPEKRKIINKKWKQNNSQKASMTCRRWKQNNPEKQRKYDRNHYRKHREQISIVHRQKYHDNVEIRRMRSRESHARHAIDRNLSVRLYRNRRFDGLMPNVDVRSDHDIYYKDKIRAEQNDECYICRTLLNNRAYWTYDMTVNGCYVCEKCRAIVPAQVENQFMKQNQEEVRAQ